MKLFKWEPVFLAIILTCCLVGCASKEEIRRSALHYFKQGNQYMEALDYHQAALYFQHAIKLDPHAPGFHYNLGLAYYHSGGYEKAIESFKVTAKLSPSMPQTYYNMALAYNKLYESDLAHKFYNKYQKFVSSSTNVPGVTPAASPSAPGAAPAASAKDPSRPKTLKELAAEAVEVQKKNQERRARSAQKSEPPKDFGAFNRRTQTR